MKKLFLRKRVKTFMILIIFIALGYIIYCYLSAIGIYNVVKYSFLTNQGYNQYISKYMTKDLFEIVNREKIVKENIINKKKLSLFMIFSINDVFNKGIIWMNYSFEIRDMQNNIVTGAWNIPMTLFLHKKNGHWRITQICETP
jgi:hypothetical protein